MSFNHTERSKWFSNQKHLVLPPPIINHTLKFVHGLTYKFCDDTEYACPVSTSQILTPIGHVVAAE